MPLMETVMSPAIFRPVKLQSHDNGPHPVRENALLPQATGLVDGNKTLAGQWVICS